MSGFDKQLRCVECDDLDNLAYKVVKPDGESYIQRQEPPYECELCGGGMLVEDMEHVDPEMN
jgi:hypothetical protein